MSAPQLQEAKKNIYDVLDMVRRRPQFYLDGERSISRLRSFLVGYHCGLGACGFNFPAEQPDFGRFHDWIALRLGFGESTSGWCNMIREKTKSEADAFEQFFIFLDEFRKESG